MSSGYQRGKGAGGMCRIFRKSVKELAQLSSVGASSSINSSRNTGRINKFESCKNASTDIGSASKEGACLNTRNDLVCKQAEDEKSSASGQKGQQWNRTFYKSQQRQCIERERIAGCKGSMRERPKHGFSSHRVNRNNNNDKYLAKKNSDCGTVSHKSSSERIAEKKTETSSELKDSWKEDWSLDLINVDISKTERHEIATAKLEETGGSTHCGEKLTSEIEHETPDKNESVAVSKKASEEELEVENIEKQKLENETKSLMEMKQSIEISEYNKDRLTLESYKLPCPLQSTPKKVKRNASNDKEHDELVVSLLSVDDAIICAEAEPVVELANVKEQHRDNIRIENEKNTVLEKTLGNTLNKNAAHSLDITENRIDETQLQETKGSVRHADERFGGNNRKSHEKQCKVNTNGARTSRHGLENAESHEGVRIRTCSTFFERKSRYQSWEVPPRLRTKHTKQTFSQRKMLDSPAKHNRNGFGIPSWQRKSTSRNYGQDFESTCISRGKRNTNKDNQCVKGKSYEGNSENMVEICQPSEGQCRNEQNKSEKDSQSETGLIDNDSEDHVKPKNLLSLETELPELEQECLEKEKVGKNLIPMCCTKLSNRVNELNNVFPVEPSGCLMENAEEEDDRESWYCDSSDKAKDMCFRKESSEKLDLGSGMHEEMVVPYLPPPPPTEVEDDSFLDATEHMGETQQNKDYSNGLKRLNVDSDVSGDIQQASVDKHFKEQRRGEDRDIFRWNINNKDKRNEEVDMANLESRIVDCRAESGVNYSEDNRTLDKSERISKWLDTKDDGSTVSSECMTHDIVPLKVMMETDTSDQPQDEVSDEDLSACLRDDSISSDYSLKSGGGNMDKVGDFVYTNGEKSGLPRSTCKGMSSKQLETGFTQGNVSWYPAYDAWFQQTPQEYSYYHQWLYYQYYQYMQDLFYHQQYIDPLSNETHPSPRESEQFNVGGSFSTDSSAGYCGWISHENEGKKQESGDVGLDKRTGVHLHKRKCGKSNILCSKSNIGSKVEPRSDENLNAAVMESESGKPLIKRQQSGGNFGVAKKQPEKQDETLQSESNIESCSCKPELVKVVVLQSCKCSAGNPPRVLKVLQKTSTGGNVDLGYHSCESIGK